MAEKGKVEHLFGWLGRQVGHVKKAVKTDVTQPAASTELPPQQAAPPPPPPPTPPPPAPAQPNVIYRDEKAEEVELPDQPGVKLRRTVIDEVIVEKKEENHGV
jgi:hypothetical protein